MRIYPGKIPIGDYVCSSHSIDGEGQVRSIPAGTIVHIGGIPFRTTNDTLLSGTRGNFCLANEPLDEGEDSEENTDEVQEDLQEVNFQPCTIGFEQSSDVSEIDLRHERLWALNAAQSIAPHGQSAPDLIWDAREILKFLENG